MIGQQPAVARQYFPEGGQPYPIPMPPEGSQNDPIDTGIPSPTVRCVIIKNYNSITYRAKNTGERILKFSTIPWNRFIKNTFYFIALLRELKTLKFL